MSSPHVAFAVILAFSAVLNCFGNRPPPGPDSTIRCSGYVLSGSCRRSARHKKVGDLKIDAFEPQNSFPYAYDLINDLIYKSKWSNFVFSLAGFSRAILMLCNFWTWRASLFSPETFFTFFCVRFFKNKILHLLHRSSVRRRRKEFISRLSLPNRPAVDELRTCCQQTQTKFVLSNGTMRMKEIYCCNLERQSLQDIKKTFKDIRADPFDWSAGIPQSGAYMMHKSIDEHLRRVFNLFFFKQNLIILFQILFCFFLSKTLQNLNKNFLMFDKISFHITHNRMRRSM